MRHRDIHLLTVGRYTYTSDQRFEAMHSPHAEDWTLRIRYAQRKDSGIYECQISTTPPIGHSVFLNVVGMYFLVINFYLIKKIATQSFYELLFITIILLHIKAIIFVLI